MNDFKSITNCIIGENTRVYDFVNLYGCKIGDNCMIGTFVEIQNGVTVGNNSKVQSHSFICEGVTIEENVFIGHGVMFINDKYPQAVNIDGSIKKENDWKLLETHIFKNVSIGSNATILGGISIGENSIVGAGSVVTKNVPSNTIVYGNPAKIIRKVGQEE